MVPHSRMLTPQGEVQGVSSQSKGEHTRDRRGRDGRVEKREQH